MPIYRYARKKRSEIDWGLFWVVEVLVLAVPFFFAIFSLPRSTALGPERLVALLGVQLGFTVVNFIWVLPRKSHASGRQNERKFSS